MNRLHALEEMTIYVTVGACSRFTKVAEDPIFKV